MGRTPCCDKKGLKKGPWTSEEDEILVDYINGNGHGSWRSLPKLAGLLRCGKSCRLRWANYLRPDIKRGPFTPEEEKLVIQLHGILGNRWASIASQLPGRTYNEIKNLWNTHLKKRFICMGVDPQTNEPFSSQGPIMGGYSSPITRHIAQWESSRLEAESQFSKEISIFNLPGKTGSDYFLRIWNSEVGESFRKINDGEKSPYDSLISQVSSSAKGGSVSAVTTEIVPNIVGSSTTASIKVEDVPTLKNEHAASFKIEDVTSKSFNADNAMEESDSSSSNESNDSSDITLELLLDYPGNIDMSFLQDNTDYYAVF